MASSHWALSQKAELANSLGVNNAVVWDFLNSDRYWVGYTGNTVQDMDVPGGHNENATAVEYPTSQREAIVHIANLRLQGAGVLASIHPGMVATDHVLAQFDPFDAPGAVKHDRMIMVQGKENKPDYDAKVYKDRVIVGEVQRKVLVEGATGKQRMALRLEGRDDWQEDWKVRASMGFTAMGGMGEFSVTADVRVVAHEIGHYLEDSNTALQGAVQNMIVDRAVKLPGSPEFKTIKLSETSDYYREDEIVYEFKPGREFITPYAQKMYSSYKVNGVQMHASEVISSGVEWMFTKPLQFAMKDREHFNLIARAMLGDPTLMDRKGKESVIPLP